MHDPGAPTVASRTPGWRGGARPFDRSLALEQLAGTRFDVLVIGGGITGAGVALDAAARGLRTALVEKADFASGTSSRSSKLVHGGLRYVRQGDLGLVYEGLSERSALMRNAPHLVATLDFLIPLFGGSASDGAASDGAASAAVARTYSTVLTVYDLFGGWRIGARHRRLSAEEVRARLPAFRLDGLVAGFVYPDASADDARLALAVARTAVVAHGAVAANHLEVVGILKDAGRRVSGARVVAEGAPAAFEVRADAVVNATGVWADEVRGLDGFAARAIRPAKGVHVVVARERLECDAGVVVRAQDGRDVFVLPWRDGHTYVGTTDTAYDGPLDAPAVERAEVDYLLGAVNQVLARPLRTEDLVGCWAGLRPLLATPGRRWGSRRRWAGGHSEPRTADLSRRHAVLVSRSGLVTITGGKLTTYRKMAADAVDAVVRGLGNGPRRSPTRRLPLVGAAGLERLRRPGAAAELGVSDEVLAHLVARYGGEAPAVAALIRQRPDLGEPLHPSSHYLAAEVVHSARAEMAATLADVLERRMRIAPFDRGLALAVAPRAAGLLAAELGWTEGAAAAELDAFTESMPGCP